MVWRALKNLPDYQLWIGIAIMVGFSAFSNHQAQDASRSASADSAKASAAVEAIDEKLCTLAIPSWEARRQLIFDINEPTSLAEDIDPKSEQGQALQRQIDANNKKKEERKQRTLILNGPRPQC